MPRKKRSSVCDSDGRRQRNSSNQRRERHEQSQSFAQPHAQPPAEPPSQPRAQPHAQRRPHRPRQPTTPPALTFDVSTVSCHDLGPMTFKCQNCLSFNFKCEKTGRKFSLCCHGGRVKLPPIKPSDFFRKLLIGKDEKSKNYRDHIRSFNSANAMVSFNADVKDGHHGGPYFLKIHGAVHHKIGDVARNPGPSPSYGQLYFFETDSEATLARMNHPANSACNAELMGQISRHLLIHNPFCQQFQRMGIMARSDNTTELTMVFKNLPGQDMRRYNAPTLDDVAVIFRSNNGEPPGERDIICYAKNAVGRYDVRSVSVLNKNLDPMAYPLLFVHGDEGWQDKIPQENPSSRGKTVSMLQFASYRLADRVSQDNFEHEGELDNEELSFSILHRSEKLFLQWIVDMYVRIEGTRLAFIKSHQANLRADTYINCIDYLEKQAEANNQRAGKMVILPSTFIGSPRNMNARYQDAMAIVRSKGKPDLFITVTCNPNWPEITSNLKGVKSNFRPDLVCRVFKQKVDSIIKKIRYDQYFGECVSIIYTIEFQKRGLPHCHMLITLAETDKPRTIEQIDAMVSAEIPQLNDPLRSSVLSHMIHGPCSVRCFKEGTTECAKNFPKAFLDVTNENLKGYPVYRRRQDNNTATVRNSLVDNRYVVPYNRRLLKEFDCHINVEVATTVQSVKYIYKYIYKGYDQVTVTLESNPGVLIYDEVKSFVDGRYVGSCEAAWRIFEYPMHYQMQTVIPLDVHLPNQQNVYFREEDLENAVNRADNSSTKLLAWFKLNQQDASAREFLYTEIPQNFTWNISSKKWNTRERLGNLVVSRLYTVNPKDPELFHLRLLLLHVKGAKSFEDLRTVNDILHPTFVKAAQALGIAHCDNHYRLALDEVVSSAQPSMIRDFFAYICALNTPSDAKQLWLDYKEWMIEDFTLAQGMSVADAETSALIQINSALLTHNTSVHQLKIVDTDILLADIPLFNVVQENSTFESLYEAANDQQKQHIDTILASLNDDSPTPKLFIIDAPAGCGKTYVQRTLMCKLRSQGQSVLPVAFTGIAASLVEGGRTLHNAFKLPIPLLETSVSSIKPSSAAADKLRAVKLIIMDEVSMTTSSALTVIDRLFRDIAPQNMRDVFMGGKVILFCGDFRQTLPVVPHAGRAGAVEACIKHNPAWNNIVRLQLTTNMRVDPGEEEFAQFLLKVGNDKLAKAADGISSVLPARILGNNTDDFKKAAVDFIYGDINNIIDSQDIADRAILAPTNEDCNTINQEVLNMLPGQARTFYSIDSIRDSDANFPDQLNYQVDYLNSIEASGLPRHRLQLKKNAIVLLMRNLNTAKGLINGTRLKVIEMDEYSITCKVLTGASKGQSVLIPKIKLTPSAGLFPFDLERMQFPLLLAFAMTINKSQGQSIKKLALLLPQPVFAHGQLYTALSRAKSFDGVRVFINTSDDHQEILPDGSFTTLNVVFHEVLSTE